MKFAIVGAGAIGGYLGARLAHAGHDVTFIARNRNLQAIQAHGFKLILEDGTSLHAPSARAVQDMAQAGPQDAVLLTVKAHQVKDLLPGLRELFGPQTMVVTMINGVPWWYFHKLGGPYEGQTLESVDPGGLLAQHIEPDRVIGSVVYPAAELVEPGLVKVIEGNRFTLGEPDGSRSPRIEALSKALMESGFKAPVSKDIRSEIWVKLWGNLSFNPISALTHATLEAICNFAASR
ncbi:MAG: 2-dehydropantoate 2-reductase, partial [Betaproteobacteria bacterium]|nr:2-dehydropantoate 2-reductase [Betaproteobacteria bacterium]